jgi:chromate transporter
MQSEVQEKRQWIGKEEFVEGLALVNMLPGPPGAQLSIFLGHAKGSLIGGILAGVCFILPAFFIMLALSAAYVAFGGLPTMRSAFYGIGPVVVGIFAVSVYRLGKAAIKEHSQIAIGVAAAGVMRAIPATVKRSSFSSSICSTLTEKTRRPSPWSSARRVDFARSAVRQ